MLCLVPKLISANSPFLPPKNSAGIKDIGSLILLLNSKKEVICGSPIAIVSHFSFCEIKISLLAFLEFLLFSIAKETASSIVNEYSCWL